MIRIKLTFNEAEHLLAYNTGYLSCPLLNHPNSDSTTNGDCEYYHTAKKKIELALENEKVNGDISATGN